jgi:hypothetical protein
MARSKRVEPSWNGDAGGKDKLVSSAGVNSPFKGAAMLPRQLERAAPGHAEFVGCEHTI